ncbi:response regulator [Frigidibacter oleivorans]|uniref:response regulator n=1 Tax=Frigidibacter oleivorans TaxID=2487129 RepID=UPI000F8C5232|nr:response regulator [Frigidibacter oleivorans]
MSPEPIRFLLVDDLEDNLVALEALLRRDGLEMHRARSGAEALELMLANDYALALLDVQMPGMDGYELAELMRGTERTRKIPIIFVTAAAHDDRRLFRGYEAGAVDYIFKPIDPIMLRSKAKVFFELGRQAQELQRQRDETRAVSQNLAAALSRLRAHQDNSPLAIVELNADLVIRDWSKGAERMFGRAAADMLGQSAEATGWIAAEAADRIRALVAPAAGTQPLREALSLTALTGEGRPVDCECYGSFLSGQGLSGPGGDLSLSLQMLDVTERRRAEEVRNLLIGELNHRVKNTLANVQAIARQTLRRTNAPERFVPTFAGRLQALAGAHSILSDATWHGAELAQLVADQVRVGTLDADRLDLCGPRVRLSPEHALRMALTLHELATNAAKYGALSVPSGRIALDWTVEPSTGEVEALDLVVRWQERGGPAVVPPAQTGFGSTLIGAGAMGDGAAAEADWQPGGVIWTIRLPVAADALLDPPRAQAPARPAPLRRAAETTLTPIPLPPPDGALNGRRLLVIEDEALVALDLVAELEEAGAEVVGQAASVPEALELLREIAADAALLDGNLGGQTVDDVAAELARRGIPFCFVSGYGREHLPQGFAGVPVVEKPFRVDALLRTVETLSSALPPAARPEPAPEPESTPLPGRVASA